MNKALLPRLYKELLQINKKTKNSIKIAKDINKYSTTEEIWMENNPKEKIFNLIVTRKMCVNTTVRFFTERESDGSKYCWGWQVLLRVTSIAEDDKQQEFFYAPKAVKIVSHSETYDFITKCKR